MHCAALIRLSLVSAALRGIGGLVSTQLLLLVPGAVSAQLNMGAEVTSVSSLLSGCSGARGSLGVITRAAVEQLAPSERF